MTYFDSTLTAELFYAIHGGPRPSERFLRRCILATRVALPFSIVVIQYGNTRPPKVPRRLPKSALILIHPGMAYLCFRPPFGPFEHWLAQRKLLHGPPCECARAETFIPTIQNAINALRDVDLAGIIARYGDSVPFAREMELRAAALRAIREGAPDWRQHFTEYSNVLFVRSHQVINNTRRKMLDFLLAIVRDLDFSQTLNHPFRAAVEKIFDTFGMSPLQKLFAELAEQYAAMAQTPRNESALAVPERAAPLARRAAAYMSAHFNTPIGLADVAEALRTSDAYLSRVFRQETGHTITGHLQALRIQHAKELLAGTDLGTHEIAAECGFGTPEHFFRTFRRLAAQSPRAFRRAHGG